MRHLEVLNGELNFYFLHLLARLALLNLTLLGEKRAPVTPLLLDCSQTLSERVPARAGPVGISLQPSDNTDVEKWACVCERERGERKRKKEEKE